MPDVELTIFNAPGEMTSGRGRQRLPDPAIAAAFAAFHRATAPGCRFRFSAARRFVTSSAGAFAALALAAFAGGLLLAHFSFNSSEHRLSIASLPPEIIYARPALAQGDLLGTATVATAKVNAPVPAAAQVQQSCGPDERAAGGSRQLAQDGEQNLLASGSFGRAPFPEATANFAAAMRLDGVGVAQARGGANDVTYGYAGVELPSVPEPATGPLTALSLAVLLAIHWVVRIRGKASRQI